MPLQSKIYETVFIINATIEDSQIEAIIEKTKDFISKSGANIRSVEKWGRRRLTYTIKKKNNGFYVLIEFASQGDLISKLERYYHLEEQIIRHLTIQLDAKALKAKETSSKAAPLAESPDEAAKPHAVQS